MIQQLVVVDIYHNGLTLCSKDAWTREIKLYIVYNVNQRMLFKRGFIIIFKNKLHGVKTAEQLEKK